jgi:uncharacterized protein (TIGR02147 family)
MQLGRVSAANSVNVFQYLDYRVLVRELFEHKKRHEYGFSHRAFARRAGLTSSNFLVLVMKGERNVSAEAAERFASAFGLAKRESEYFVELVAFNQAKTTSERARCYERLSRYKQHREIHKLAAEQAAYHSAWYIPVVRELSAREDFRDNPRWIAQTLQPRITTAQAKRALAVLEKLELLKRDGKGVLRQAAPIVTTGVGPLARHVVAYHRMMLQSASRALDSVPRDEREISSLTLCVSHDVMLKLKERIREFRRELLHVAEQEGAPERVVQLNFQLFPLSQPAPKAPKALRAAKASKASKEG